MACQKHLYRPVGERKTKKLDFGFSKYTNSGLRSQIIK
jgi:hypothetical protein